MQERSLNAGGKRLLIMSALALSVIALVLYKNILSGRKTLFIRHIPKFETIDRNGHVLRSNQLRKKPTYIQFIDLTNKDDLDLITSVYNDWGKEEINLIAFVKPDRRFPIDSYLPTERLIIVHNDYELNLRRFRAPHNAESFYIADRKGAIISSGFNRDAYERDVKTVLLRTLKRDEFSISQFIDAKKDVSETGWLRQISDLIQKGTKEYYLISFFTKICDTCSGGTLIQLLKEIDGRYNEQLSVVSILLDAYNEQDITTLQSQLFIDYPVYISDSWLSQRWRYLIDRYREADLTDIILFIDRSGRVLDLADRSCACWNRFYGTVRRIMEEHEKSNE